MQTTNQQLIKSTNMKTLFSLILNQKACSRIALAKATHLSKATVSTLVDELMSRGYVLDCGAGISTTTGRKPNTLEVNGADNYVAVFQWHRLWLNAALISLSGNMIFEMRISMGQDKDYVRETVRAMHEDLEGYNPKARILGVCVIVPAIIEETSQRIVSTVLDIDQENDIFHQLRGQLAAYPVAVLNDTACYAYAECVSSDMWNVYHAYVNIGSGVGAVILDHGHVFRAANGMTTQFGHFSVDRRGPLCSCGNRGCLERVIGETYLYERSLREGCEGLFDGEREASFELLGKLAAEGNEQARKLLDALAEDTAYAISNLISMFNPQEVIIGGKGMALGALYLDAVNGYLGHMGFPLFTRHRKLSFSNLSRFSALKGAARYYIDQYYSFDGEMQNRFFIG